MSKEIKFKVRLTVDGKEQLITATTSVNAMRKAMGKARTSAQRFTESFIHFNQGIEVVRNLADAFSYLDIKVKQSRAITQLTGETDGEMRKLRNSVQVVADYFGKDFEEVLRSVNSLSKGFGISMDAALKLVRSGLVSGADAGGDFLDTVREYPRYFKEAGLSAEDFIAISTNAAKQGVFSDKGVDTIKEGNLRIREMTKATADALNGIGISANGVQKALQDGSTTTFEVMQQVAAKLKELPASSSKVGTAIADIFGGPGEDAGLEYIKTLADVKLSMDDVKAATNGVAEQQERQIQLQENIKNGLSGIIDLTGIYAQAKPFLDFATQIGFAVTGVTGLANALKITSVQQALFLSRLRLMQSAALLCGVNVKRAAAMFRLFHIALTTGAHAATAMKLALRGLMSATVVGAALMAVGAVIEKLESSFDKAGDEAGEAAKGIEDLGEQADTVKEAYDSTLKSTYADLMSKYDKLRAAWQSLSSEQEKITWIKNNQTAFNDLRLKINGVSDAENIFNGNTDAVVEAFSRRAKAAAYAAKLASLYEKQIELFDKRTDTTQSIAEDAKKGGRKAKAGDVIPDGWRNERYGSVGRDGVWRFSEQGAKLYSGTDVSTNPQVREIEKQIEDNKRQIEDTKKQIAAEKTEAGKWITSADTAKETKTNTGKKTEKPAEKGSVDWYESRISDLRKKMEATSDTERAKKYKSEIDALEKSLQNKKLEIGINTDVDIDQSVSRINELKKELETVSKSIGGGGNEKTQNDVQKLQKEINTSRQQAYDAAKQKIDDIQKNYEIGIIDKDKAIADIGEINAKLKSIDVQPIDVDFKTHIEQLQDDLSKAQKEFDNAVSVEARVKAEAKINEIQAEIDEATKGKITIEADVEPSYIVQGSAQDKRQSYSNARQKADRIQQDYEIGIIGKDEALQDIAELNLQVEQLGMKPIKIEVMTEDIDKAKEKMRQTTETLRDSWNGVKGVVSGMRNLTDTLNGDADGWTKFTTIIDTAVQMVGNVSSIIGLFSGKGGGLLGGLFGGGGSTGSTAATAASAAAGTTAIGAMTAAEAALTAASAPMIAANKLVAASFMEIAAAAYFAAHAYIPFTGFAIAAGFVASAKAAVLAIGATPFADGGVVSGPTLALVGEYAGASNNPEVIAPLDKLRTMLQPQGVAAGGVVRFEIDGTKLVGVLANRTRISSKSGKRTNIIL